MLHHGFCLMMTIGSVGVCYSVEPTETQQYDVVTEVARRDLQTRIAKRTVLIERRPVLKSGYTVPGGHTRWFRGWLLNKGHVLTASVELVPAPIEAHVHLFVQRQDRSIRARVHKTDKLMGLAILKLEQPATWVKDSTSEVAPKPSEIWMGRPIFAWSPTGVPDRFTLGLPKPGQFAYFWRAQGELPVGTPLTDAKGRLLTLVGSRAEPGILHLLPPDALTWGMAEARQAE